MSDVAAEEEEHWLIDGSNRSRGKEFVVLFA